jgi:putative transposase
MEPSSTRNRLPNHLRSRKPGCGGFNGVALVSVEARGDGCARSIAWRPCIIASNVRRDVLAKLSTRLAQRHDVIVIEDLNCDGMGRRKPRAGAGGRAFNRALRDAAFGQLRRQLSYKADWYGATLVVADRWYPSSKTCPGCGERKPSLQLAERTYACDNCDLVIDRDVNAAVNLARLGDQHSRPAGSGPVAGRGADHKTEPGSAGGCEASTPSEMTEVVSTGTATSQGEAV